MVREHLDFGTDDGFNLFLNELQGESDRACAVLAGAYLDVLLEELLAASFVETFNAKELLEQSAPLGSFSSRIHAAHAMGLISATSSRDLHLVRRIRNEFAHHIHGIDFASPSVRSRCGEFTCVIEKLDEIPTLREEYPQDPRAVFNLAVGLLSFLLRSKIEAARRPRPTGDPD